MSTLREPEPHEDANNILDQIKQQVAANDLYFQCCFCDLGVEMVNAFTVTLEFPEINGQRRLQSFYAHDFCIGGSFGSAKQHGPLGQWLGLDPDEEEWRQI